MQSMVILLSTLAIGLFVKYFIYEINNACTKIQNTSLI